MFALRAVTLCTVACIVAIVDGVLKFAAIRAFSNETVPVNSFLDFGLHKNPGIVFDIPLSLVIILPLTVVLCVFLALRIWQLHKKAPIAAASLCVIMFGAIDNAVDRAMNGFTTDYLIFFQRSAINMADILIVTGVVLYLYYSGKELSRDGANF